MEKLASWAKVTGGFDAPADDCDIFGNSARVLKRLISGLGSSRRRKVVFKRSPLVDEEINILVLNDESPTMKLGGNSSTAEFKSGEQLACRSSGVPAFRDKECLVFPGARNCC